MDTERYYDSIPRFVLRDVLLTPLTQAMTVHGVPKGFRDVLGVAQSGVEAWDAKLEAKLERLLVGFVFHCEYRNPDVDGRTPKSSELISIRQRPVLSTCIGIIALFPVDEAACSVIHRPSERGVDSSISFPAPSQAISCH